MTKEGDFRICHTNVDGAGMMPGTWTSLYVAMRQADQWQQEADLSPKGNLWRYRYHVFDHRGCTRYTSQVDEQRYQQAEIQLAWEHAIERTIRSVMTDNDPYVLARLYHVNYLHLCSFPPANSAGTFLIEGDSPLALRCSIVITILGKRVWDIQVEHLIAL